MFDILKIVLPIMILFTIFVLAVNSHYKRKYGPMIKKLEEKGIDCPESLVFSRWSSSNTQSVCYLTILIFFFSLMFQTGMNSTSNIDVGDLVTGKYDILSTSINGEDYYLLTNSYQKIIFLSNEKGVKWLKDRDCEFILKREENLEKPYVEVEVERVGDFWKDAFINIYAAKSITVHLKEDSQIFDYSGIEKQMTVHTHYH
jgi:hypothetical protein